MAQIKAHEFDRLIAKGPPTQPVVLVYGPDRGLVAERAAAIAGKTGIALDDPFSVIRLEASDIQADPGRLIDETSSIGLFGGKRLVWIKHAMNERALVEAVLHLAQSPPTDCFLILEGGDLKKGAGLRKAVEDSRSALAVPCYTDDSRDINTLIDAELGALDLRIAPAARQMLTGLLGGDRLASRAELQKLALYAKGKDVVAEEDVAAIVGDAAALSIDDAVDAVLSGDPVSLDQALGRIIASKSALFLVLQACLRQFQQLDVMRQAVEQSGKQASAIVSEHGRRIHFKRKPAIEKALARFSSSAIQRILDHLQNAVLESRRRAPLEECIVRHALMAIAIRAAKTRPL